MISSMEERFGFLGGTPDDSDELHALIGVCGGETRGAPVSGTKALMLAVLQEGIQSYLGKDARARTEAEVWIMSGRRTVFSFNIICESLGLEADWVRAALGRLRAKNVSPRAIGRLRPNVRHTGNLCPRGRRRNGVARAARLAK
jgi:hypothetical protein